ncbi:hypothetical protein TrispH2_003313 [Trichoplax sp. H2]|uniref:Uncharacterized protein n=1 Tax=Trichoplax adhaerens TaxID=10228 RepID=B3RYW0_TRIAD|nr:hypothetical protein TRIADDRAFT_57234 [Trichoplax adhaerens]EDV23737.1 hypothetical protein TRIADDRAFT_57234 [Trichoplax adhaerens]RDD44315.1 hypothetical protein TrispH2_003313 [Trichoplax sp. H2]|eukprot:XP_002113263.1 hypothetical protein TRIADDRAFT_57234 [Trichoplax adhaerens]
MADPMDVLKQLDSEYSESKNKLIMQYLADQEVEAERTLDQRKSQDGNDKTKLKNRMQVNNGLDASHKTIELHEENIINSNKESPHLPELSPNKINGKRKSITSNNTPVNGHNGINNSKDEKNILRQSSSYHDLQQSVFSYDNEQLAYQYHPTSLSYDRRLSTDGVQLSLHESLNRKRSSLNGLTSSIIHNGNHNPALDYFQPTGYRQREITSPTGSNHQNSSMQNQGSLVRRPCSVYHLPPINHDDNASNNHQKTVNLL